MQIAGLWEVGSESISLPGVQSGDRAAAHGQGPGVCVRPDPAASGESGAGGRGIVSKIVKGNIVVAGDIHLIDKPSAQGRSDDVDRIEMALVIEFKSVADIRKAMADGMCEFTSFDSRWKVNAQDNQQSEERAETD